MDAKAREELVERVAYNIFASGFTQNMANARGVARAALAVIEPVVREDERQTIKHIIDGRHFVQNKAPARLWANDVLAVIDQDAAIRGGSNGG